MGLWAGIKYALNSTLGTRDFQPLDKIINSTAGKSNFMPLDKLLSAKILLCGISGEVFHLTNKELGTSFDVTFTADTPIGSSGYREYAVAVDTGTWEITATIPDAGSVTNTVQVQTLGTLYVFRYQIIGTAPILETSESTAFQISNEIEAVIGYAAGAGGGGGSGHSTAYAGGGGGGGGGASAMVAAPSITNKNINITIGVGGAAGASGGATVLTGLISKTLPGGFGGQAGNKVTGQGDGGQAGGVGGGRGGGINTWPALPGLFGEPGYPSQAEVGTYGAGGGGSYGKGGNGATTNIAAGIGIKGGGGGGGRNGAGGTVAYSGGKGGDGYVVFYKGVVVA